MWRRASAVARRSWRPGGMPSAALHRRTASSRNVFCVVYSRQARLEPLQPDAGEGVTVDERDQISPKTASLPGTLHAEYVRCGKAACRCMTGGAPHGPYWRRYWRAGGRTRKAYVPLAAVDETRAACERERARHLSRRAFRRMVGAYAELSDRVLAALQDGG